MVEADHLRARISAWLGPLLALGVWLLPLPLGDEAHRLAAVMLLVITWWIGEPIPPAATALLGPTLALLVGAVPLPEGARASEAVQLAYRGFGDPVLMLFMGGFFIAEALTVHGLDRRFAMRVLSYPAVGGSPARVVIGLGLVSCVLSMWVSNTATTALLIPIAKGILDLARSRGGGAAQGRDFSAACMLMLPFAATVGGLATPVGTAPNLIAIGRLSAGGTEIGFLRWMSLALPLVLVMMLALCWLLTRGLGREGGGFDAHAREQLARMGPWGRGEKVTMLAFGLAVAGWLGTGAVQLFDWPAAQEWLKGHLSEGGIGLLAASLLFLLRTEGGRPALTWSEATRIDWGTLLLLGGGLSLGELVQRSGLAEAIGTGVVSGLGISSLWALVAVSAFLAIALSELSSNTATATLLVPTVIGIAERAGVSPLPPALAATIGCSFGFMLPISTPPNALAYGTGLVPITTMVRRGVVFDLIGLVLIVVGMRLLWPLVGW